MSYFTCRIAKNIRIHVSISSSLRSVAPPARQALLSLFEVWKVSACQSFKRCVVQSPFVPRLAGVLPLLQLLCSRGPAGPAWRREGGPSVPSPATWLPRGEGGVEGGGAKEAGQRGKNEKKKRGERHFSLLFFSSFFC